MTISSEPRRGVAQPMPDAASAIRRAPEGQDETASPAPGRLKRALNGAAPFLYPVLLGVALAAIFHGIAWLAGDPLFAETLAISR